jgi:Enoyl-CoA hydratase/isomerase
MACDLAVMVDDAFIRHVGLEHGSVPAGGATQWLPIFVGDRPAREIILMCEEIPAAQAAEWGLVNWVVPATELDAKVNEVVEKLATKLPQTTRYAKQQLNFWRDLSWHGTVNHARDWLAMSMLGDEAQDAVDVCRQLAVQLQTRVLRLRFVGHSGAPRARADRGGTGLAPEPNRPSRLRLLDPCEATQLLASEGAERRPRSTNQSPERLD